MKAKVVFLVLCAIWGSTWLFIKIGLEHLPPLSFAGIRFVVAVLLLGALAAMRRAPLPRSRRDWAMIGVTGLLSFTVNYGLLFWGEQYISSGLASVLQATIPAFGLVVAHHYLPTERMTPAKVAGVALGIAGVAVVFSDQLSVEGTMALWGSAAIVVGAGFWLEGSPFALEWTTMGVVCLLYLAVVGSAVAFGLYYWLVRHMDVTNTMLIALVTPLLAVVLGMIVLDERLTWRLVAGGACILAGVGLVVAPGTRRVSRS